MAAASRIAFEVQRGSHVHCAFLTDGDGGKASPDARNRESAGVLTGLGADSSRIFFIGSEVPIHDGSLPGHLDLALMALERRTVEIELDTIYCLAWEGGHQDHDASHLVASAFAKNRGILDHCFELPLYNGARLAGSLFRVFSPVGTGWQTRRLSFSRGLSTSLLAWRYRSQRRSWVGLFPETFLKLAILRREMMRHVDPSRFRQRPHSGALLYERRFRYPFERFMDAVAPFVDRHFPR